MQGEEGLGPDYTFDYDDDVGQLSESVDSHQSESEILEEIVEAARPGVGADFTGLGSSIERGPPPVSCLLVTHDFPQQHGVLSSDNC